MYVPSYQPINSLSTQIATAAEQQSAVTEEINRSMVQIRHMVEELVEGGLTVGPGFVDRVHIHFRGHGCLGFRSYSGSLLKSPGAGPVKSKQNAFAPPLGTSPRLGVPSLRHCSVGRREGPSMAQRG
ncbi:methyl-accepting chemotaxis protein [Pseudomonas brassicacearum]|uniref:methyl-accepting chemotaxis protein n=1 Tax=Pseudomonas brassicacearum TaxID=930166 RepID=UPI001BDDFDA0|nr:methyl-accepting chemotaxis protein [Pseudomonas brassicacearum]